MTQMFMIELQPDTETLLRFLHSQALDSARDEDLGYGVHVWLRAAFGPLAPQPWRLLQDSRRPPRVLGYSQHPAERLRQHMDEFADPATHAVCPTQSIAGRAMPSWRAARRLGFELLACPVGRKSGTKIEKDVFLIRADKDDTNTLRRDVVYSDWARERIEREGAASVTAMRLAGFRLIKQMRRDHTSSTAGGLRQIVRPQALLRGQLMVQEPHAFSRLLARGIGRHRAFGYGMLLLRPPS